jgi:hypothetical protein
VYEHLLYDGMLQGYTIWGCHGENAEYIRAIQTSKSKPKGLNSYTYKFPKNYHTYKFSKNYHFFTG